MIARALFVLVLLAAGCTPSHLAWQWSPAESLIRPAAARFPDAPAVILNLDIKLWQSLRADIHPLIHYQHHQAIAVLKKEGLSYAEVHIPVGPDEGLLDLHARTISPTGVVQLVEASRILTATDSAGTVERNQQVFRFPAAQVGSILEWIYTIEYRGFMTHLSERIDRELPIISYTAQWMATDEVKYKVKAYNVASALTRDQSESGLTRQRLALTDIPARRDEFWAPPWRLRSPWWNYRVAHLDGYTRRGSINYSVSDNWADILRSTARALYLDRGEYFGGLDGLVKFSAAECRGAQRCIIEKALQWLQRVPLQKMSSSLTLRPLKQVLASGGATSIERTVFLAYLLRQAGVSAIYTAVARGQKGVVDTEVPSLQQFNHLILYLPQGGPPGLWVDPSCEFCQVGEVPSWTAQQEGLRFVIDTDPGNPKLIATPVIVEGKVRGTNRDEHHFTATLNEAGDLEATVDAVTDGSYARDLRIARRFAAKKQFSEQAERFVKSCVPTAQVRSQELPACDDLQGTCRTRIAYAVPAYATIIEDRLLVPLTLLETSWDNAAEEPERRFDIYVGEGTHDEEVLKLTAPPGWELAEIPGAEQLSTSAVDVSLRVTGEGRTVELRRVVENHSGLWARQQWAQVRAALRTYAGVRQKVLIFRRVKPGAPVTPPTITASASPASAPRKKIVPAILVKKDQLSGQAPSLPDGVKEQHRGSTLQGIYKLCIAQDGSIESVDVVTGIPDADIPITSALRSWRYKPQAIPLCFMQFLEFQIE